jgi:acetyl-CoA carboxylase biotin carboxylase subunit
MAKVITKGDNRDLALENMRKALSTFEISGVKTNIPFLQFLISQPDFIQGNINIKWIENTVLPKFLATVR